MTELHNYIRPELILVDLDGRHRDEILEIMVRRIFETNPSDILRKIGHQNLWQQLVERENLQTTGIGHGLAFPHARIEQHPDLTVVFGLCKNPVDFKSLDGRPCNLICLMVSPAHKPYIILQVMASFMRIFSDESNIHRIMSMASPKEIAAFLESSVSAGSKHIFARDIMKPVTEYVNLDTPIEKTTHIMHLNRLDFLPVVDENNNLCGEISCLNIFACGMPDFFNQLQAVSFVRYMDPFEKYFKLKKELKVRDLYVHQAGAVQKEATLMEIVFQMAVKNKSELFVVDGTKLIGRIDRFSIIDRILFF